MTERIEICIAALFIGVGLAGLPLQPWSILLSIVLCAIVAAVGGRFIAALALLATLAVGWLQHHEFRVSFFVGAAIVGLCARFAQSRPKAATTLAVASVVAGFAALFFFR